MSANNCEHKNADGTECHRPRFVDHPFADNTKCIFHREKNDWFNTLNAGQWDEGGDWSNSKDKVDLFWSEFEKEWNKGKYDYSHFVFPQSEMGLFQNLYKEHSNLPAENQKEVLFSHARFLDMANFARITFTQRADFSNADFKNWAIFENATFMEGARFENTTFKDSARFENATFMEEARFENTTFKDSARFENTTFKGFADFSVNIPTGAASNVAEPIPAFEGITFFTGASFNGVTTFKDRQFKDETTFANATFAHAPDMHGAELYSNTDFTGISCGVENPGKSHGNYRWLKEKTEDTGDRRAASIFFAAEQHCLLETGLLDYVETVISWFYKSASYYGSSISLPLGWLWGFQLLFPLLFFKFKSPSLSASPFSPFSISFVCLALIVCAVLVVFTIRQIKLKRAPDSDTLDKAAILFAISSGIIIALCIEGFTWESYGNNLIMLLSNLFRPFYGWNDACSPHPLPDYLIGLLHLTLMYSAFALLLFAIRRRFKME